MIHNGVVWYGRDESVPLNCEAPKAIIKGITHKTQIKSDCKEVRVQVVLLKCN